MKKFFNHVRELYDKHYRSMTAKIVAGLVFSVVGVYLITSSSAAVLKDKPTEPVNPKASASGEAGAKVEDEQLNCNVSSKNKAQNTHSVNSGVNTPAVDNCPESKTDSEVTGPAIR